MMFSRRSLMTLLVTPLVTGLVACAVSSPQLRYLQLSAGEIDPGHGAHPVVQLRAVTLPDYLLRESLLLRVDDHELLYHPTLRWAEPLDLGIARVMALQLSSRLDSRAVTAFPLQSPSPADWVVTVEIAQFEREGERVTLHGRSRALAANGEEREISFARSQHVPGDSEIATAQAMSSLIVAFSNEIAAALQ